MIRDLKSISHAFKAWDIDIYLEDGDETTHFLATRLLCDKCFAFWHTPLVECYFCSEINYYLLTCTGCGELYSITGGVNKCTVQTCQQNNPNAELKKLCRNLNCVSNSNSDISGILLKKPGPGQKANKSMNGVFELDSGYNFSCMYCIKCGNASNFYETIKIFLFNDQINLAEFIQKFSVEKNDVIIFKKRNGSINYDFVRVIDNNTSFIPTYPYHDMKSLTEGIFGRI